MKAFEDLKGEVLTKVRNTWDTIVFELQDGTQAVLYHDQECCESVDVEDVIGDLDDLVGSPITFAYESSSQENPEGIKKEHQDSFTWTFYRIGTEKGAVTIRFYGESNGYYSESVSFKHT